MFEMLAKTPRVALLGAFLLAGSCNLAYAGLDTPATPAPVWFKHGKDIVSGWRVAVDPQDPNIVSVTPRWGLRDINKKKILVLYPRASSAYDTAITEILHVFEEKQIEAEFTAINFNREDTRGRAAIELAESKGYDLIISMGSESTAWLWDNYRNRKLPVVTVCSKDPVTLGQVKSYDVGSGTNFAFTSLNMPIESQMAYVMDLIPELRNLAILVDLKNVSAVETQAKPIAAYARKRGVRVFELGVANPKTVADELRSLVSDSVTSMKKNDMNLERSLFLITGSTTVFNEIRTINANSDRVPILSVVPEVVKEGDDSAVMSIGISFESNAHMAAIYASEVLAKPKSVSALKVGLVSPPDISINFRKARQIGLKMPFSFFESASTIYDYEGKPVRTPNAQGAGSN